MHKSISRRQFALGVGAVGVATLAYSGSGLLKPNSETDRTLISIVDTIVPRDEFAGALDLKLEQALFNDMQHQAKLKDAMQYLAQGITQQSMSLRHKPFYKIEIKQREGQLNDLLSGNTQPQLRRALWRLRGRILTSYYRSEAGRASLGYTSLTDYSAYGQ